MCGIAGVVSPDAAARVDEEALSRMGAALAHRGPDGYGLALDPGAGVISTRLAIFDIPGGWQPLKPGPASTLLVYNGEVYNHPELRAELEADGVAFHTTCDTEVLQRLLERDGPAALERLNGQFAFAWWEPAERRLTMARDRFGVRPLHFALLGDGTLVFGSEAKALFASGLVEPRPDPSGIDDVFTLWGPRAPHTAFMGVNQLRAGSIVVWERGEIVSDRTWWTPDPPGADAGPSDPEEIGALMRDSVRLRLRADVPIGSCLSGGLDSSAIVCIVDALMRDGGVPREQIGDRQRTFSAVYAEAGRFNERAHVDTVLRAVGARGFYTHPTAERLASDLSRLVWHQEEPFGSTSIFAQWCVMAEARAQGVTVLLDGQGADEPIGGYRPFEILLAGHLRGGRLGRAVADARAIAATTGLAASPLVARALARQLPRAYVRAAARGWRRAGDDALRPDFAGAQYGAVRPSPVYRSLDEYARGMVEEESLPSLLRYEDRNSMAFSVEGRVPFLDVRLMEFAFTTAQPWAIRDGWTKWILREAVDDVVPREITWRRDKVGFETPERPWMEAILAHPSLAFGDDAAVAPWLAPAAVRAATDRWRRGSGDTRRIWRWINTELWLRTFGRDGATPS